MLPSNKITLGKKYQTFVPFYFINLKNTQYSLSNLSASNIYIYTHTSAKLHALTLKLQFLFLPSIREKS